MTWLPLPWRSIPPAPLVVYAGKAAGVFKSIDGGANWSQVSVSGLSGHFISRLVLDSSNPVRARALDAGLDSPVVLALGFAPGPGGKLFAGTAHSVFRLDP